MPLWLRGASTAIWSLRVLLVAAVLVPFLLFALAAAENYRQVFRDAERDTNRVTALLREHALKVIETDELITGRVQDRVRDMSWEEIKASEQVHDFLAELKTQFPQVESVFLTGPDGVIASSSRQFPMLRFDASNREYFTAHRDGEKGTFVSEPFRGGVQGTWAFTVSRPRQTPGKAFDGVIAVTVSPDYFATFYRPFTEGMAAVIAILRDDGKVLVRHPPVDPSIERLDPDLETMRALRRSSSGFIPPHAAVDRSERISGFSRVGPYPIWVVFGLPTARLHQEWRANLVNFGSVALPAALALCFVGWLALRRTRAADRALAHWHEEAERRREAEAAALDSKALYSGIFHHAADGLFLAAVEKAKLTRYEAINPAFAAITGLSEREVIGKTPGDIFTPEEAARIEAHIGRAVAQRGPLVFEQTLSLPGGERVFQTTVAPVRGAEGRITRVVGALRDVTEQKAADATLAQSRKMETVGRLTGGVAHDFNNLLTAVTGNLDMLLMRNKDPEQERLIQAALRASERGARLTRQLLAFSRKQQLELKPVDLADLVRGMQDILERTLGSPITIETRLAEGIWPVLADRTQLEFVLLNLALNARDAMPENGAIEIEVDNVPASDNRRPPDLPASLDCVMLAVIDKGTGMAPEVAERAFEPFFTTKEVGKGTGLGLSQVYGVAKQSGGAVRMDSRPGQGTTVQVFLPRATVAERDALGLGSATGKTVLIVDDDTAVREVTAEWLSEAGFTVIEAASGHDALERLTQTQNIDFLVSDVAMPGMSGTVLAETALRLRPDLRIILITGFAESLTSQDLRRASLLRKPFARSELIAEIGRLSSAG